MNLNIDEIYDNVESYRNANNYSQDKMAEILGLANKQAYQKMMKNKSMKLIYIINLVNKSNLPIEHFFHKSTKIPQRYKIDEKLNVGEEPCPCCERLKAEVERLNDKLNDKQETIEALKDANAALKGEPKKEKPSTNIAS